MLVTQYEGSVIEDTGLIKMDFLGLKTLSIIKDAVENIRLTTGRKIDIDDFSIIDDPATYKLYLRGPHRRDVPVRVRRHAEIPARAAAVDLRGPDRHERALPARPDGLHPGLHRPQARPQSDRATTSPCMEKYLKDTYGITVYQEQVMLLSRLLANFTRGESRHAAQGDGQEAQRQAGPALKPKFIKGGTGERPRPEGARKDLGRLGEVRLLCLQQVARHVLLVGGLSRRPTSRPTTLRSTWRPC